MFQKTSFTTLIVGVFVVYVLHTCWVMYGIVYTKPCENPKFENCINPYLAGKPRLQVCMHHCKLARWNENLPVRQLFWVWKLIREHLLCSSFPNPSWVSTQPCDPMLMGDTPSFTRRRTLMLRPSLKGATFLTVTGYGGIYLSVSQL